LKLNQGIPFIAATRDVVIDGLLISTVTSSSNDPETFSGFGLFT
jgi:hypothetical protein